MNRESRVGLIFLIGIAAAIWLTVATGDVANGTGSYAVHFPAVGGLDVGSEVRYNGVPVGRVKAIDLLGGIDDAPRVAVRFDVDERFLSGVLIGTSTVFRINEGILGGSILVIEHQGAGNPISTEVLAGAVGDRPAELNEVFREITELIEEKIGRISAPPSVPCHQPSLISRKCPAKSKA